MATTLQSQLPTPSQRSLYVPKQGSLLKLLGGLVLAVSFFMPALTILKTQETHTLFSLVSLNLNIASSYLLVAIVPIFYMLGLTTFLLILYGRFTQRGVSRGLLVFHILTMVLVFLASGTAMIMALTFPENQFGIFLVGPAMLVWLALVIQFGATWLMKGQHIMWRVVRSTQLCGGLNLLVFAIILLDTLYYKQRRVQYGLLLTMLGSLMLTFGNDSKS